MKYIYILLLLLFSFYASWAQEIIRGRVFDASTNAPIVGATILAIQNDKGTVTNKNGRFELAKTSAIQVSAVGYQTQDITIENNTEFLTIGLAVATQNLEEVVVSANPTQEKLLESTAAVSIISKKELQRDNQTIITPALNRIPGVYMHSGALNTNRITIRGIGSRTLFSTNKVRAYLNDIPLTTGAGETTLEDIDLSIINRVEVIKGPSSSLYGAGLGGTIHLSTEKAGYRETELRQNTMLGSYGLLRSTTALRSGTDKANINLLYNTTHSDGYRENNETDRSNLLALAEFYPNEKHTVTFLGNFIRLKAFIPSSIDSASVAENPQVAAFTWQQAQGFEDYDKLLVGFSHQFDFHENWKLKTAIFTGFRNSDEQRPFNILKEETQNVGIRSFISYSSEIGGKSLQWIVVGEYFRDDYQWRTYENDEREVGTILSDNAEERYYFNAFWQGELVLNPKFTLQAGLNINQTNYTYRDFFKANGDQSGAYEFETTISPRIALRYQLSASRVLFANVSHGFSPPSVEETLTPSGQINPDIQPETGWNFELGTRGKALSQKLFYSLSFYTMQIENLLVARRVGNDQFVGINAGRTVHNGVEAELKYTVLEKENTLIQAFANTTLSFFEFDEFVDGENDYSGNALTGTPEVVVNAGVDWRLPWGLYGNFTYQFVDEMPLRDDNSIYSEAYQLINGKLGWQKTFLGKLKANVSFGINNIFDAQYAAMLLINAGSFGGNAPRYYYPGLPRNWFGGVALTYTYGSQ